MKQALYCMCALSLTLIVAGIAAAQTNDDARDTAAVIVTASNTANNQLMLYDTSGVLLKQIPTEGQGGVGGNSGGIAQSHDRLAVVNFGSGTVSVFAKHQARGGLHLEGVLAALASPVSVAFGHDHMYILSTTHIESHRIDRSGVSVAPDGAAVLLIGDGSAAQVGALPNRLIFTENSNAIESVNLASQRAATMPTSP